MVLYRFLLLLLAALLATLPAQAQILRGGQCRPTIIHVQLGGTVCERLCYRRGYRGPPILCRRVYSSGKVPVCGNGCCISGPNCLQLLYT
ncbi:uncharacterized protein LOC128264607 [Drosophila gunungcola]|uniref:Secreted protein n=1 Tax=Drosophila gunungcola TaxID=103775 RepID=A0A9P9YCD9_9MUSC|nr:uncharacterized protein LOC128264607 [Drosophila gunungcola]KAI8034351.1 hypothetical protein M5D96_012904 [Drosophila gunungcola]